MTVEEISSTPANDPEITNMVVLSGVIVMTLLMILINVWRSQVKSFDC